MIRPTEMIDIQAEAADNLDGMYAGLNAQVPDGFELVGITPSKGTGKARRVELWEITIESRADLAAAVPDGWQALSTREA